jgi:hypothetical protein
MEPPPHTNNLFETQGWAQWAHTLVQNLERETGVSLAEWAQRVRQCGIPPSEPRRVLRWLKETHGLGQNRGYAIFEAAYPGALAPPADATEALHLLFASFPAQLVQYQGLRVLATGLGPDVGVIVQKSQVSFMRGYKFAQAKPAKRGLLLGLHLGKGAHPPLGWQPGLPADRITALRNLAPDEPLDDLLPLLQTAYTLSARGK